MSYNYFGQQNQNSFMNQQMFLQPTGNVYSINNSLEVANVPTGAGVSVALCMPENLLYIKTIQNGSPLFWSYKITPYNEKNETETAPVEIKNNIEEKIQKLENKIDFLVKEFGGENNE